MMFPLDPISSLFHTYLRNQKKRRDYERIRRDPHLAKDAGIVFDQPAPRPGDVSPW